MRNLTNFLALVILLSPIFANAQSCSAIKPEKQRLACYDKSAAVEKPADMIAPAKNSKPGEVFQAKSWHVNQKLDAMTDKKSCTALYKNAWTVQGTEDNLYISLRGRGGVKAYTLRIDDEAPDPFQMATASEKDISAVDLKPQFERIYNGKRVRVQIGTILGSILVEDIDLNGFKEAVDYIRANCNV